MTEESKKYRIYDKTTKQWYEIPKDQYRKYDRWHTALRNRLQYRGECGATFKRRINYTTDGSYSAWSCKTHLGEKSKCSMLFIRDNDLKLASEAIMNKLIFAHRLILKPYAESLKRNSTSCRRSSSERPTASRTTMPSPMKSLRCASKNHSPRQTPAAARRPGSASPSCRTSSEVSNPKSPNSTKASSER